MTMNGFGIPFKKKVKIEVKLPHVNKIQLPRKQFFLQTPFPSYLRIRMRNNHAQKAIFFAVFPSSHDQNHRSNNALKIIKKCDI